jgi:hypothetical protein
MAWRAAAPRELPGLAHLSDSSTARAAAQQKQSLAYRGALAAVILLGILIVIALALLVAGFVMRLGGARSREAGAASTQFTAAPGQRLVSAETSGDRLVVRLSGPAGDEIDVVDLETGRLVTRIRSTPPQK